MLGAAKWAMRVQIVHHFRFPGERSNGRPIIQTAAGETTCHMSARLASELLQTVSNNQFLGKCFIGTEARFLTLSLMVGAITWAAQVVMGVIASLIHCGKSSPVLCAAYQLCELRLRTDIGACAQRSLLAMFCRQIFGMTLSTSWASTMRWAVFALVGLIGSGWCVLT